LKGHFNFPVANNGHASAPSEYPTVHQYEMKWLKMGTLPRKPMPGPWATDSDLFPFMHETGKGVNDSLSDNPASADEWEEVKESRD
jgi:hypothetical protein